MRHFAKFATAAASIATLLASVSLLSANAVAADSDAITMGKKVAEDRKKGNCLACHQMGDGASPGNIGPPLIAMKARFPDRGRLYDQIWDAQKANPATRMPPFGKHEALSKAEVDAVVDYLYTL